MDNVIECAKKLKEELNALPLIKEFLNLKKEIEVNDEIKELKENLAYLKNNNKEEEYKNLLKIYHANPLINNYEILKEDVYALLDEIKNIIEK